MPASDGMCVKKLCSASRPPAEAPMPTTGKRRTASSRGGVRLMGRLLVGGSAVNDAAPYGPQVSAGYEAAPSVTMVRLGAPPAPAPWAGSSGCTFRLRLVLPLEVEHHRGADERLERRL